MDSTIELILNWIYRLDKNRGQVDSAHQPHHLCQLVRWQKIRMLVAIRIRNMYNYCTGTATLYS